MAFSLDIPSLLGGVGIGTVITICVSIWRVRVAVRNNQIAASSPWVALVMAYVDEELKNAQKDHDHFSRLCLTPVATLEQKRQLMAALEKLRDESGSRLYWLQHLAPKCKTLLLLKTKLTNVTDTYFENEATALPSEHGKRILREYQTAASDYFIAVRNFASKRENFS